MFKLLHKIIIATIGTCMFLVAAILVTRYTDSPSWVAGIVLWAVSIVLWWIHILLVRSNVIKQTFELSDDDMPESTSDARFTSNWPSSFGILAISAFIAALILFIRILLAA